MAKGPLVNYEKVHKEVLHAAAIMFLKEGYTATSIRAIAKRTGYGQTSVMRAFGNKEALLCELVRFVLDGQFNAARKMLDGVTDDPVLYYAAETTLQLYMAESDEAVRDLYSAAYSLPESAELIYRAVSEGLLREAFQRYLPEHRDEDFYQLEIASGGIIRGYMTIPCSPEFTIAEKVQRFLEASLRVYRVPEDKIAEAQAFVKRFDYPVIAKHTIHTMLSFLQSPEGDNLHNDGISADEAEAAGEHIDRNTGK